MAFKEDATVASALSAFLTNVQNGDEGEFPADATYFRDLFDAISDALDTGVDTGDVTDRAITTAKIALLAVTAAELAGGAVITAKLGDLAVTLAKMAAASVDREKVVVAGNKGLVPIIDCGIKTVTPTWNVMTVSSDGSVGNNAKRAIIEVIPTEGTKGHTTWPTVSYYPLIHPVDYAPLQGGENPNPTGLPVPYRHSSGAFATDKFKVIIDVNVTSATQLWYPVKDVGPAAMENAGSTLAFFWALMDMRAA